jgi:molybdenum cofactor guanylyltransferase
MQVAGFVLTGGRSSRMGRDKALLPWGARTLVENIAQIIHDVTGRVCLIGHPERYRHLPYPAIEDRHPDLGPISGLETALNVTTMDWNLVLSCDVANLKREWLEALISAADCRLLCAAVQDSEGNLQPLCAIYHRDCLHEVSRTLDQRELRLMDLLNLLKPRAVPVDGLILNLNTPEQFQAIANVT